MDGAAPREAGWRSSPILCRKQGVGAPSLAGQRIARTRVDACSNASFPQNPNQTLLYFSATSWPTKSHDAERSRSREERVEEPSRLSAGRPETYRHREPTPTAMRSPQIAIAMPRREEKRRIESGAFGRGADRETSSHQSARRLGIPTPSLISSRGRAGTAREQRPESRRRHRDAPGPFIRPHSEHQVRWGTDKTTPMAAGVTAFFSLQTADPIPPNSASADC